MESAVILLVCKFVDAHVEVVGERHLMLDHIGACASPLSFRRSHRERLAVGGNAAHDELGRLVGVVGKASVRQGIRAHIVVARARYQVHHEVVRRVVGRPCVDMDRHAGIDLDVRNVPHASPHNALAVLGVRFDKPVHVADDVREVLFADARVVGQYVYGDDGVRTSQAIFDNDIAVDRILR